MQTRNRTTRTRTSIDDDMAWFETCIELSQKGVFSETREVSPAFAQELLNYNPDNRTLRQSKLRQYTEDMKFGRWTFNGEPLIVAKDGNLNDGQHRLFSLIEADVTLKMLFIFGVDRDSRTTLDQGAARTAGDYLLMEGKGYAIQLAAIGRFLISYERANGKSLGRPGVSTSALIVERARRDERLMEAAIYSNSIKGRARKYLPPSLIGFCYYVFDQIDHADALQFMDALCIGENLDRNSPILRAREKLLALDLPAPASRVEIVFRAWNAFRENRALSVIPIRGQLPQLV